MLSQSRSSFSLALITGASSGIGAAFARLLVRQGISLILVARDLKKLEGVAKEFKDAVSVTILSADLETEQGCNKVVEVIKTTAPDLVVNSAGFGLYGEALAYPTEDNLKMVDLNIKALMQLTIEASRVLIARGKRGTILNISSASDLIVFPGFAVYAATKAFVTQFSQSLDVEVKPQGVRVLVSCPGVVRTEFRKRASGKSGVPTGTVSMDVDFAAKELWKQVVKGNGVHYFDMRTRLMVAVARFLLPRWLISRILYKTVLSYVTKKS